jgi:hypothetical protein
MQIKWRPSVIIISVGLVLALNGLVWFTNLESTELIAFGGTITTALAGVASKLVESEEKTP